MSKTVAFECAHCLKLSHRTRVSYATFTKRNNFIVCVPCARKIGATKRPQNCEKFLSTVRMSEGYYDAISKRDTSGPNNPMYGRKASLETRLKMSATRTGKVGVNATAWKGGKLSFNKRIKASIQRKYKWFSRVIERDGRCMKCLATHNLDAHHILPVSTIIKIITADKSFLCETEKYHYVIEHQLIVDADLTNGITLCRDCHKLEHINWGSHEPEV